MERRIALILLLTAGLIFLGNAPGHSQTPGSSNNPALLQELLDSVQGSGPESPESSRVSVSPDGFVRYLGTASGNYFPATGPKDPEARARAFLDTWQDLLYRETPGSGYATVKTRSEGERIYVRLQQLYTALPVFGAEIIVQLDAVMNVTNVHSDIMRDFSTFEEGKVGVEPTLSAAQARTLAIEQVVAGSQGTATEAVLMIYSPAVVGAGGSPQLVWQTIVESISGPLLKDMVLLNAHTGAIAFRYPLIHDAKNREIYDSNNTTADPGTLERAEGDPVSAITDVNLCYDYFGDTYDFYAAEHGRDSLDNAGMTLSGTVRYCYPGEACPFANAFWDGSRMYFGEGFSAADDVVSHELTHGVTTNESNLVYSYQSGAINESLSDIWGEFVDLTNSGGTDTPEVRWQMGEDVPGFGAIRDMADPPAFSDPDRMGSPLYYTGSGDYGGVHTNSGVGNKLCYLLTDGDSFNGFTVTGMGISKVADLFYECQVNLLTSSSDYLDLHNALLQAAINLGFTQAEYDNVALATQAVEIDGSLAPDHDECGAGICVADGVPLAGSSAFATGTDITSCASGDTLDVWHDYVPTVSGSVTISTAGSSFDTTLAAFDACGGTELACNDDTGDLTSEITITVTAGLTYRIRVSGYGGGSGNYILTVTGGAGVCGGVCAVDEDCTATGECGIGTCLLPDGVCVYTPDDTLCDDLQYCNGVESCSVSLLCQAGTPVDCDDADACTTDICDEPTDTCISTCGAADWEDPCCEELVCDGDPICVESCVDLDGDGYGSPASALCTYPEEDCDDSNPDANPGATEICTGGADEDCDGLIDNADTADCGHTAATLPVSERVASDVDTSKTLNYLACYLIVPMGARLFLSRRRKKK